jgi:hypothetical protein
MPHCNALIKKTREKCKCKVPKKGDKCRHHPKKKRGSAIVNMTTKQRALHEIIIPCRYRELDLEDTQLECGWYIYDEQISDIMGSPYSIGRAGKYYLPSHFKIKLSNSSENEIVLEKTERNFDGNANYKIKNLKEKDRKRIMEVFTNNSTRKLISLGEKKLGYTKNTEVNLKYGFTLNWDSADVDLYMTLNFFKYLHIHSLQNRIINMRDQAEKTALTRGLGNISQGLEDSFESFFRKKKRARVQPGS